MKKDMGGAAIAMGLGYLVMSQQLPIRLRLLVPAAENSVSGNAFRPGDVLHTHKGLTVEIDNTDAEGRLLLCDALSIASDEKTRANCRLCDVNRLGTLRRRRRDSGYVL